MQNPLDRFFNASSIAIIGVSRNELKPGHIVANNLIDKFFGDTFLVSNSGIDELLGHRVYSSVLEINDIIDLAVILTPAPVVPFVLKECVKKRIQNVFGLLPDPAEAYINLVSLFHKKDLKEENKTAC